MEEERMIGGVASPWLKKSRFQLVGYGLYVTNKRLIGIGFRKAVAKNMVKHELLGAPMRFYTRGRETIQAAGPKTLQELNESKKDFEIGREQIFKIELTKPGIIRGGRLRVPTNAGTEIEIVISGKNEYESLSDLMKAFPPGAVTISE